MLRILAAVVLAICLIAPAKADSPPQPSPTAMAFAGQFSDVHLSGMLSKLGGRQPAMMAYSQLGGTLVSAIFDAQIDLAVEKYGPEWQRNMALAWGGLMPDEALQSLIDEGADSPFAADFAQAAPEAASHMQRSSDELFQQILAEVVDATTAELAEETAN